MRAFLFTSLLWFEMHHESKLCPKELDEASEPLPYLVGKDTRARRGGGCYVDDVTRAGHLSAEGYRTK